MRFGTPLLLLLLLTFVPVLVALVTLARWRRSAAHRLIGHAARRQPWLWWPAARMGLILTALALLGVAAARPQVGARREPAPNVSAEVVIALDASLSMLAEDVGPNRFERGKVVATALLDRLYGDRVGVVAFAGSAKVRFPLTMDITAAKQLIPTIAIKEGGLEPSTGIADGIREAVNLFPNDGPPRGRAVVLISDGEDLAGAPLDGALAAQARGVVLHTIGVGGDAYAPIFLPGMGGRRQPLIDPTTGQQAQTRREVELLRDLAWAGGGRYVDGNNDEAPSILSGSLNLLQRGVVSSEEQTVPIEWFQPVAAVALLLLILSFVLPEDDRRRGAPRAAGLEGTANERTRGVAPLRSSRRRTGR
jgi:Ca-activated chloride channel family protein